ncbi:MAG: S-layer homology domain-containing protein, partial [Oscillospiraceae bacterium]|nr:S-layer homology domain-containing protein [Oscillospiraceae bacterium]
MKRSVSVALTAVLLFSFVPAGARTLAASEPSGWAVAEMNEANVQGFLTPNAQKDFRRNLTRAEFCEIVVALIERTLGREIPLPAANPFSDTSNIDVQKASLYGNPNPVVNGVGGGLFAPDKNVSRQEIVAMVARAMSRLSSDTGRALLPTPSSAQLPFKDNANIADWAVDPLRSLYANGVVKGDNYGNFNPLDEIKSEECVAVVLRANNAAQAVLNSGLSAEQLVDKAVGEMR